MALDADAAAALVVARINAEFGSGGEGDAEELRYQKAVFGAWIDYIRANMDVLPGTFNVTGTPVLGIGKVT